jgi:hypothetical protein
VILSEVGIVGDDGIGGADGIVVNHSRHSSKFAEDKSIVVGLLSIYISD